MDFKPPHPALLKTEIYWLNRKINNLKISINWFENKEAVKKEIKKLEEELFGLEFIIKDYSESYEEGKLDESWKVFNEFENK